MVRILILLEVVLAAGLGSSSIVQAQKGELEGVVNINTATAEELALIPSVGPARIRDILAYRHAHPFRTVDELARIKGIGRKTVRRWRQHLAVAGPSTAVRVVRSHAPPDVQPSPTPAAAQAQPRKDVFPAKPPTVAPQSPVARTSRRGEPSRRMVVRAASNHCSPPP